MSKETVSEFIQKVQQDEQLREQVMVLGQDADAVVKFAAGQGYNFDRDTFQSTIQEMGYASGTELSEDQLENVAGGGTCQGMQDQADPRSSSQVW